ncbi:MAG: hypothetical protein AAGA47_05175 [Pseudomonadota bacterium]
MADILAALRDTKWKDINVDVMKFIASAIGFGLFILGYSYSNTFFRSFGLSLSQTDVNAFDFTYRAIELTSDGRVIAAFILVLIFTSILWAFRSLMTEVWGIISSASAVLIVILSAVQGGKALGLEHSQAIWKAGAGRTVFCRLNAAGEEETGAAFVQQFYTLASQERLRLIHMDDKTAYIAPRLTEVSENRLVGESYAIPVRQIAYCRTVGSYTLPPGSRGPNR